MPTPPNNYKNFEKGISIIPKSVSQNTEMGELEVLSGDGNLYFDNGTVNNLVITETNIAFLTNKTISGSVNIVTDINNSSLVVMADGTFKGNISGSPAIPSDVSI